MKEYNALKKILSDKKVLYGDLETIIITYGNYHEICEPAGRPDNIHKWTMAVNLSTKQDGRPLPANKFIEKVRYELDEDFSRPIRDIKADYTGKFELTMKGWGYFVIPITITWRKEVGLESKQT